MAHDRMLGYGRRNDALMHIDDVVSGLACDCVCDACGHPLVARKGAHRRHHFAHYRASSCANAVESVLHRLAKHIFLGLTHFEIPGYPFRRIKEFRYADPVIHTKSLVPGGTVRIDAVRIEPAFGDVRPDIEVVSHGKALLVEIEVTHGVDRRKRRRVRQLNLPTIQIHLSAEDALLPLDQLTASLRSDLSNKEWIYHPNERDALAEFYAKYRATTHRYLKREKHAPVSSQRATPPGRTASSSRLSRSIDGHKPYGELGEAYYRQYGRYPTFDQALAMWPDHFGVKKNSKPVT